MSGVAAAEVEQCVSDSVAGLISATACISGQAPEHASLRNAMLYYARAFFSLSTCELVGEGCSGDTGQHTH